MTLPVGPGSWQQVSGFLLPRAEDAWRGLKMRVSVVRFSPGHQFIRVRSGHMMGTDSQPCICEVAARMAKRGGGPRDTVGQLGLLSDELLSLMRDGKIGDEGAYWCFIAPSHFSKNV